ncbi:MAG: flagellar protein FlaG [Pseudohaliea sp.]
MIDNSITAGQGMLRPAPARATGAADAAPADGAASMQGPAPAQPAVPPAAPAQPAEGGTDVGADMREMLEELSQRLNDFVRENARELEFRVDGEGDRVVILVRQAETGDVLRTIPPEEALALADKLGDGAGVLVSQLA